jgi:alkylation response protein AidB-like acyl-CoA dehydrogenase
MKKEEKVNFMSEQILAAESAADKAFRQEIRAWLKANITAEYDPSQGKTFVEQFEIRRKWQRKLFSERLIAIGWAEEYGGRGAPLRQQIIYNEEMARAKAPGIANAVGVNILGPAIASVGSPEQKAKYLPEILSGDKIWCQGFSEPDSGSDVASAKTMAVLEGDEFVINGQKVWTSLGWLADYAVVLCRTDPSVPKHKGLSYIVVDMKSPGVKALPLVQMTGDPGFSQVFFENVRAPKENLIGKLNGGWNIVIATLMHERATWSFNQAITFEIQMNELLKLAKTHKYNGRLAIEDRDIKERLAKCYTDVHLFKLMTTGIVAKIEKGGIPGIESSFSKLQWSEMSHRLAKLALDITGEWNGAGVDEPAAPGSGHWQERYMFSLGMIIGAGSSDIQHNIIAERVLGLPLLR